MVGGMPSLISWFKIDVDINPYLVGKTCEEAVASTFAAMEALGVVFVYPIDHYQVWMYNDRTGREGRHVPKDHVLQTGEIFAVSRPDPA